MDDIIITGTKTSTNHRAYAHTASSKVHVE